MDLDASFSKYWGQGDVHVIFSLPHGKVVSRCKSRSAAAKLLWKFRQAQKELRSKFRVALKGIKRPPAHVDRYEKYSLRWIANRLPVICVRGADVGGKRKSAFVCQAPLFRHYFSLEA